MKGRKGMELRGTKIALAAVLTCLLSLTAWLGVSQLTARAEEAVATASANAYYNVKTDELSVRYGDGRNDFYKFFTVADASKKVPSANQWVSTDGGTIGLSGKTGAAVYYFSNSTSPEKGEVVAVAVPAVSTIQKVKYDKSAQTFIIKAKHSNFDATTWKSKVVATTAPKLQYSVGNTGEWKNMNAASTADTYMLEPGDLEKLLKTGATINVRVQGAVDAGLDGDHKQAIKIDISNEKVKKAGIIGKALHFGSKEGAEVNLRKGAAKQVKIAKISVGPAVTIDYANHALKLKKGMAYLKQDTPIAEPDASSDATAVTDKTKLIYREGTGSPEYYVVCKLDKNNKKSSSYTHVEMKADKSMAAAASADATISGVYEEDATLTITQPKTSAKTVYQYAIGKTDLIISGNAEKFDYDKSVSDSNGKLKWKSATVKNQAGSVSVKLTWKSLKDSTIKYVYVRKAAVAKNGEYSSQVIRFTKPTSATENWVKHIQGGTDEVMPSATIKYIANGVFMIKPNSGSEIVSGKTVAIIGKKEYTIEKYSNTSNIGKTLATASADALADALADAYYFDTANDLKQKAKLPVKFTIKAGAVKNTNNVVNSDYTFSTNANTLKPVISKVTVSGTSVVYKFNSALTGPDNAKVELNNINVKVMSSGNAEKTTFTKNASGTDVTIGGLAVGDKVTLNSIIFENDFGRNYVALTNKHEAEVK